MNAATIVGLGDIMCGFLGLLGRPECWSPYLLLIGSGVVLVIMAALLEEAET